jgi:hypothetical protein
MAKRCHNPGYAGMDVRRTHPRRTKAALVRMHASRRSTTTPNVQSLNLNSEVEKWIRFSDKQWRIQGMVATNLAKSKSAGRLSVAARSWGCRWSMPLFQRYPAMGSKTVSEPARITRSHNRPRTRILLHEGYSRLVLLFRGVTVPNIIGRLQLPRAHRVLRASLSSSS